MRKVLVEFDEQTFKRLEQVASDSSSRRSDFIRGAVRRALWELEGPAAWATPPVVRKASKRRSKSRRR